MAAFQFPDPNDTQTVVNPITGSTYQWKEPPGKWVVTTKLRGVSEIIYEGDNPPNPVGDYKLWYSTDTLELYFHYCDANGVCAWVPTSTPITMLEDLDAGLAEVKADVVAINQATNTNENRIETIIAFSETAPTAYPDAITPVVDDEGNPLLDENGQQVVTYTPDPANHKFWLKKSTNELHILRLQDEDLRTYDYELIAAVSETPDLEAVLKAGNVADESIVLTNAADDALLLSPDEARVMIAAKEDVVPKFELRHTTGALDTSLVELELDENGRRFDIECDERVDNIHFRFNDDVKLALNKDGDAVFGGKVQAEAATKDEELVNLGQFNEDQLRQDKALILLEGEIEQLAPSFARGTWNWDDGDGYVDSGEYVMRGTQTKESYDKMVQPYQEIMNECLSNAVSPPEQSECLRAYDEAIAHIPKEGENVNTYDWEITNEIEFSNYDSQGNIQTFEDVKVGQILDMVCPDGSFMVAEITKVTTGQWYENPVLEYKPITTKGDANGLTKLKIFSIDDNIDPGQLTDFVRKSGDTMDGHLKVTNPSKTDGTYLFSVEAQGLPYQNKKVAFRVTADGKVKAGHDTSNAFIASANNDVVTKKFTDDKLVKKSGDKMTGTLTISKAAQDSPSNSFIINQFVTQPDGTSKSEVLLKDYKPQKTAEYKSSLFYYGLCDNDLSLVNRGYANGHYFQLDEDNEATGRLWLRPYYDDNGTLKKRGGAGVGNMLVVNQESDKQGSIVRIQQEGEDCLKVEVNKRVNMFHNIVKDLGDPRSNSDGAKDAANRDYVDKKRLWKWTGDQSTSLAKGTFSMASSGAGYLYFHPVPEFGTRLKCSGNKYLCKGGDGLDGAKEFGYAMYTIWAWEDDHWEPAISGHISATGIRTGKGDEPWRFSSNKNTVIVLEGLTKDKLYNITVAGTILS